MPHDDRDLARGEIDVDAVQHLARERAFAVGVAQVADGDERLGGRRHRGDQKISAGRACRSLRVANAPAAAHMPAMRTNTSTRLSGVIFGRGWWPGPSGETGRPRRALRARNREGENEGLAEHEAGEKPIAVTDRLQGGVFRQMLRHVGVENLIHNDRATTSPTSIEAVMTNPMGVRPVQ